MKRREFCGKASCTIAGAMAASLSLGASGGGQEGKRQKYKIEVEIYEARKDTWCHKKGDKFTCPQDMGKVCPWLRSSMHDFIRLMESGVTLPWKYKGTPYEKVIDPKGVTTEYVRCPDPTANLVAKIIRTAVT